jgi:uncharacterized protein with HEPN domain
MRSDVTATQRWLADIRHHIDMAQSFVAGMTIDALKDDFRTIYAVVRCLEIISEASRRLPEALKSRHPSIAWKNMAGAGNVYRHDYEDVTLPLIWVVLQDHMPALRMVVEHELSVLCQD